MGPILGFADNFVNVDSILSTGGYTRDSFAFSKGGIATSFAVASLLNKVTLPARLALDAVMVPFIAEFLKSRKQNGNRRKLG